MNIDSIKNGYVIDHISAGQGMKIYEYLKLGELDCSVAMIMNARSTKMGKKDIIKIDQKVKIDFDVLGYIDPNITINVIENDKKVKKFHPELKNELIDIVKCKNPRCITSVERGLKHICVLKDKESAKYRCKYCDSEV
ncbi:MAG: aspartate carbamoyltransferase regulatory subunit [Clostridia bacterium]|nr:aspartate carbamoyltransferase regulatory subunit [Clostridia bacterium]